MKEKEIKKLQNEYEKYYARSKRAGKFANSVGLKAWSADSSWVSDSDSRKPTMYIPDAIRYSILGNIFVSPFILLFSGFPRSIMYSLAKRNEDRNFQKAHMFLDEKNKLINVEEETQDDATLKERIKVVENKNLETAEEKIEETQTVEDVAQSEQVSSKQSEEVESKEQLPTNEEKNDLVM